MRLGEVQECQAECWFFLSIKPTFKNLVCLLPGTLYLGQLNEMLIF